ncbi:MAG: ATPase, partial [Pseudomonadota bacterium]
SSAVLALAVEQGRLPALEAFEVSILDAAYQAECWGRDAEAEAAEVERRLEAAALGAWFEGLGAPS